MKGAYWMIFTASLIVLLAAVGYCWQNESGHSGVDPLILLIFFGPVFAGGLVGRLLTRGRLLSARSVEVVGFVGMAFGFFITKLGILNLYEDWIAAGMPERNPNASILLTGFVLGGLGGSLAIAYLITPKAEQDTADNPHQPAV